MADITAIKPIESLPFEIKHPGTGKPIGLRWIMRSINDPQMDKLKRSITDEKLKLNQRGKDFTASDILENRTRILMTAAVGWEWYNPTGDEGDEGYDAEAMPDFNGDTNPAFNPKNVKAILTMPSLNWMADQLNEAISDEKAFFTN